MTIIAIKIYSKFIGLKINDVYNFLAYYSKLNRILNSNLLNITTRGNNKMSKAARVTEIAGSDPLRNLYELMAGAQKPADERRNNAANATKPSGLKDVRPSQVLVRYTCVAGETTKTLTLKEPSFIAPRVMCPGCSNITIEGRGLRVRATCYWEKLG